jgi:hypothetical protein
MRGWFDKMAWAMKLENSFKVFTMSTVPDTRWHLYSTWGSQSPHISKKLNSNFEQRGWLCPEVHLPVRLKLRSCTCCRNSYSWCNRGGQLSSVKVLVNDITAAGLNIESIKNIGPRECRSLTYFSSAVHFEPSYKIMLEPFGNGVIVLSVILTLILNRRFRSSILNSLRRKWWSLKENGSVSLLESEVYGLSLILDPQKIILLTAKLVSTCEAFLTTYSLLLER